MIAASAEDEDAAMATVVRTVLARVRPNSLERML
jgi:hypothetical protein